MKALAKLVADFVAWRWAPTVAILTASLFYVLVVVGLVPTDIHVPITNPQFKVKPAATANADEPLTVPAAETLPAAAPVPAARNEPADFGRRGFSPPLARPEPPPAPPPPPPPPLPAPVVAPPPPVVPPQAEPPVAPEQVAPPPEVSPPSPRSGRVPGLPRNMTTLMRNVTNALAPVAGGEPNAPPGAAPPGSAAPGNPGQPDPLPPPTQ